MKTTKLKILSILLIAALSLTVLAGCSSGAGSDATTPPASGETAEATAEPEATTEATETASEANDVVGVWYLNLLGEEGSMTDPASIGFESTMTFSEDNTATIQSTGNEERKGTWVKMDDQVVVTMGETTFTFALIDDNLVIEEDNVKMIFGRERIAFEDTPVVYAEGLPANLADLAVVIEGDAISMPISVDDFFALGWEATGGKLDEYFQPDGNPDARLNLMLEPKHYTAFLAGKGGIHALYVYVGNLSDSQTITARQGIILGMNLNVYSDLPKGIRLFEATGDEVKAAYGEPDSEETSSFGSVDKTTMKYERKDYRIAFTFDNNKDGVLTLAEIDGTPFSDGWSQFYGD